MKKLKMLALATTGFLIAGLSANVNLKKVSAQELNLNILSAVTAVNNNSLKNAQEINLNSDFKGSFTNTEGKQYYKVNIAKPGKVDLSIKDGIASGDLKVMDSNNSVLDTFWLKGGSGFDEQYNATYYLNPGTYYLVMSSSFEGKFNLKLNYTEIKCSFPAKTDDWNRVSLNQNYTGMMPSVEFGKNDTWYSIDGDNVHDIYLKVKTNIHCLDVCLFGENLQLDFLGKVRLSTDNATKEDYLYKKIHLDKDVHLMLITSSGKGTYSFSVNTKPLDYKNNIEAPKENSTITGKTIVKGWYLYGEPISKIEVLVDGKYYGVASRSSRNDVKNIYQDYDASKAGYSYTLDTTKLSNGRHKIQLKATGADGKVNWSGVRNVNVKNKTLIYKSSIETPKYNSRNKGKTTIKGWYVYGKKINRIDVYIDGKKIGQVSKRSSRYDLKKWCGSYDLSKAEFYYTVDFSKYKKGYHKIMIKAIGADGTSNCSYSTINVTK